jgi:hypothetical protein
MERKERPLRQVTTRLGLALLIAAIMVLALYPVAALAGGIISHG